MKRAYAMIAVGLVLLACGGGSKPATSSSSASVDWPKVCAAAAERAKHCPGEPAMIADAECESVQKCFGEILRPEAISAYGTCISKEGCEPCEIGGGVERSSEINDMVSGFEKACRAKEGKCPDLKCDDIKGSDAMLALRADLVDEIKGCFDAPGDCDAGKDCVQQKLAGPMTKLIACATGGKSGSGTALATTEDDKKKPSPPVDPTPEEKPGKPAKPAKPGKGGPKKPRPKPKK